MQNENEIIDSNIDTETTENNTTEETIDEAVEETQAEEVNEVEVLRKEVATLKAQKDHWKVKATRPKETVVEQKDNLSERDMFALLKADVAEEDIEEVKAYARYRKTSVAEAIKDKTLQSILSDRNEERRSAQVANTTRSARGVSKVSGEQLLSNASQGKLPDEKDIEKLVEARMAAKLKR